MVTRILHISDLHYPSRDDSVKQALEETISRLRPDILVITGDLANHPSLWWVFGKGRWRAVQRWLRSIRQRSGDHPLTILTLPGNHDTLVFGLFGWCWPPTIIFKWLFKDWFKLVHFDPKAQVTILTLDTNPRLALASAEGKAFGRRLSKLKQAMERHPHSAEIRRSTKVLLMHHHPLPVPFQGQDWLLHTRRVDRLLRFLAENQIDLVLHGHKHRATWSHIRIGGVTDVPLFIEILGAGAAMKRTDYDPRGHNLNLIDIASGGVRHARQYFKKPGNPAFAELEASDAEKEVGRLVQVRFRQPYRMQRLTWCIYVDEEGDGRNELRLEGLVFNRSLEAYEVPLWKDTVIGGQVDEYRCTSAMPEQLGTTLVRRNVADTERTFIAFSQQPTSQSPANVVVENYDLNSYSMDQREAVELGLPDTQRDYVDLLLTDPVDELVLDLRFPNRFRLLRPRLEVFEPVEADIVHQGLTAEFGSHLSAVDNRLRATLRLPPPNYRFHVSWELPPPPKPQSDAGTARRSRFEQIYLGLLDPGASRGGAYNQLWGAIIQGFQDLYSELEKRAGRAVLVANSTISVLDRTTMDLSFMVCDRYSKKHPELRLILWSQQATYAEIFREFRLLIGEGNAGRAYKTKTVRLFDAAASNPRTNTYRSFPGKPQHHFLFSVPLLDPRSELPLAVFSAGTPSIQQADLMRALKQPDLEEITRLMQAEPLKRLLDAAGLAYN
ncbi:MAG TPA: metallophosphoesterase [Bryobacteraceae bacterium]|nr:metallophosphoesterase [Bryobacteraceae bacterium]